MNTATTLDEGSGFLFLGVKQPYFLLSCSPAVCHDYFWSSHLWLLLSVYKTIGLSDVLLDSPSNQRIFNTPKTMNLKKTFASALVALSVSVASMAQTADEIVAKHIAAIGGADKLKSIESSEFTNKIAMGGMEITVTLKTVKDKASRQDVNVMGNDMTTAFDGTSAWAIRPQMMGGTGEPEALPEEVAKASKSQVSSALGLAGALAVASMKGAKFEVVAKEKVDGAEAFKIKGTNAEGKATTYFVSASNFYLLKVISMMPAQGGGEQESEITFSNFKAVDGIVVPHSTEMPNPQMGGMMTMELDGVKWNAKFDESIFKMPKK
jgi:outer membrane lipoprotein-sorting protein